MVIKRELAEKHPWAVLNILKAFERANAAANRQRVEHTEYHVETGLLPADARKSLQVPIVPTASRPTAPCSRPWRNIRRSRG